MLLVHVVHGSSEIVGDADSICSLRAGISTGIIVGAIHPCWQCGGLMIYWREGWCLHWHCGR